MKNRKYQCLNLLILLVLASCGRVYHKSDFIIADEKFVLNPNLNIKGFFIDTMVMKQQNKPLYPRKICVSPMVLFGDGTAIKIHGVYCRPWFEGEEVNPLINELKKQIEFEIENNDLTYKYEPEIWDWGMYRTKGNEIDMQVYKNHQGDYHLVDYWGEIKNDSTIIFNSITDRAKKIKNGEINEEYRFCAFDLKPDSTNYITKNIHKFKKNKNR